MFTTGAAYFLTYGGVSTVLSSFFMMFANNHGGTGLFHVNYKNSRNTFSVDDVISIEKYYI